MVQLTTYQHWFRWWLGAGQATSHCLNQWWLHYQCIYICVTLPQWVNSLWPSDAIRRQGTESTLAQVMACCLTAPSHYLNQGLEYGRRIVGARPPAGNYSTAMTLEIQVSTSVVMPHPDDASCVMTPYNCDVKGLMCRSLAPSCVITNCG